LCTGESAAQRAGEVRGIGISGWGDGEIKSADEREFGGDDEGGSSSAFEDEFVGESERKLGNMVDAGWRGRGYEVVVDAPSARSDSSVLG